MILSVCRLMVFLCSERCLHINMSFQPAAIRHLRKKSFPPSPTIENPAAVSSSRDSQAPTDFRSVHGFTMRLIPLAIACFCLRINLTGQGTIERPNGSELSCYPEPRNGDPRIPDDTAPGSQLQ